MSPVPQRSIRRAFRWRSLPPAKDDNLSIPTTIILICSNSAEIEIKLSAFRSSPYRYVISTSKVRLRFILQRQQDWFSREDAAGRIKLSWTFHSVPPWLVAYRLQYLDSLSRPALSLLHPITLPETDQFAARDRMRPHMVLQSSWPKVRH